MANPRKLGCHTEAGPEEDSVHHCDRLEGRFASVADVREICAWWVGLQYPLNLQLAALVVIVAATGVSLKQSVRDRMLWN